MYNQRIHIQQQHKLPKTHKLLQSFCRRKYEHNLTSQDNFFRMILFENFGAIILKIIKAFIPFIKRHKCDLLNHYFDYFVGFLNSLSIKIRNI